MQARRHRGPIRLVLIVLAALAGSAAPDAWAFEVTVSATVETPAHPLVRGVTNLPDGAVLIVQVDRAEGGRVDGATTAVKGGAFTAGPFSEGGHDLEPGEYAVDVRMELPAQPHDVRRVVGTHGMEMQGPLLSQRTTGQIVSYRSPFTVAGGAAAQAKPEDEPVPGAEPWQSESCHSRLAFLNRTMRANKVSGHQIAGSEATAWLDDCVRSMHLVPRSGDPLP